MIISQKIFSLLEQRGMSQKEFSARAEISPSTISDWKRKKTNPSADKIIKKLRPDSEKDDQRISVGGMVDFRIIGRDSHPAQERGQCQNRTSR